MELLADVLWYDSGHKGVVSMMMMMMRIDIGVT